MKREAVINWVYSCMGKMQYMNINGIDNIKIKEKSQVSYKPWIQDITCCVTTEEEPVKI